MSQNHSCRGAVAPCVVGGRLLRGALGSGLDGGFARARPQRGSVPYPQPLRVRAPVRAAATLTSNPLLGSIFWFCQGDLLPILPKLAVTGRALVQISRCARSSQFMRRPSCAARRG